MERKRNPARKSVDVSAEQYEQLIAHAMAREQHVTTLVRHAIADWLAAQEPAPAAPGAQTPTPVGTPAPPVGRLAQKPVQCATGRVPGVLGLGVDADQAAELDAWLDAP